MDYGGVVCYLRILFWSMVLIYYGNLETKYFYLTETIYWHFKLRKKYLVLLTKSWLSFDRYKNTKDSKQRKNLWPYIAMRALKPHAYTYTSKHIYMIQVNEGNKLWGSAFCPFRKLIITLYQVEIIFCLHPDHKIPQYDHLLKALALKESHAAFTMWGMYLQTIQHKKIFVFRVPALRKFSS